MAIDLELNQKVFSDLVMQNAIHMNQGQLSDDQAHRRRTNIISEANLVAGLERINTIDPAQSYALRNVSHGAAIDSAAVSGGLAALVAMAVKMAQTTAPTVNVTPST